ncbi:hypothetical protein [Arcanobacterium hippocoleae]|uniref:hypothetical protein n=1 Tax=Arcanobacterium hippocoleae TaxID=149017 RepID=UPI00334062C6
MNTFNPRFNTHDLKNLASAAYYGTNQQIYQELSELSELVGIQIISLPNPSVHTSASHRYPEKSLLLPAKQSVAVLSSAVLNFTDTDCAEGRVRAAFHPAFAPYFADGSVDLDLRADAAEILELMAAVGATIRGQVLGVIGAQGGIGTSTTSLWIAREFARRNYSVALIDLDPNSPGLT